MSTDAPFVPERPLQRFLALLDAVVADRKWYEPMFSLQYAASSLITEPGEPRDVVRRLRETAAGLKQHSKWTSPLRSEVRNVIAAVMLRAGHDPERFIADLERIELLFKQHGLSRGRTVTHLAALLLMDVAQAKGRSVGSRDVERMAAILAEMKTHHRFLTGADDYPACALLSGLEGAPSEIGARCEVFYEGLHDLGFSRGNALQLVSHLLVFAPADDRVLMSRFRALYDAFKTSGMWMSSGDYDEIACLSFLDCSTSAVVSKVVEHRDALRAHKPKPDRQLAFSLACSTAFIELAQGTGSDAVRNAQHVMAVHAIIMAQQAAMAAVAVSTTAAASSASN